MALERLVIGTANFGLNYGINNERRLSDNEVSRIFKLCSKYNISLFDTAKGYGDSQERIIAGNISGAKVITKLKINEIIALADNSMFMQQANSSRKIYALLVHDGQDINVENYKLITKICLVLKQKNIIEKWGLSIYDPSILKEILSVQIPDIIQLPFNILDNRLINGPWPDLFTSSGVEVHARSIFLQGILLRSKGDYPSFVSENLAKILNAWDNYCKGDMQLKLKNSIEHVAAQNWISKLVIGIDSAGHLQQIIDIFENAQCPRSLHGKFHLDDDKLLNPSNWRDNI